MAATEEEYNEHVASLPQNPQNELVEHHGDDLGGGGGVEKKWPGWPGESVFRILVPTQKVGGIIGRKGEFIKRICEESRARIKILDVPGTQERPVLISAKEEPDLALPPAIDGLLRVHKRIADGMDDDLSSAPPNTTGPISSRLLAGAAQAGSLIGKQGSTIKSIQEASNCIIRVLGPEDLPLFALPDDRIIEVQGEGTGVHKAVELIASHLRKFLVDRSVIGVFETQMQDPHHQMDHNMPPPQQSWASQGGGGPPGYEPHNGGGPPGYGPGPGYGHDPQYMMPPRQHDNYYPPPDQSHQGLSMYGRDAPPPPQPVITQVTQHMQVPLSYADAVIGNAGANISYTRRASGATITIQETRGVPSEMTVEINGSASQVQTAQQLIQNYMAEAASAQQNTGNVPNENSYATQGAVYQSPPNQNHQGGAGQNAGGNYGGPNYGGNSYGGPNYGNSYGPSYGY